MSSIRVRPLTAAEERYLRNNEGKAIIFSGPLSIIGSAEHRYVSSTIHSDIVKSHHEYLGNGDYILETTGCGAAEGGKTVLMAWGLNDSMHYVLFVAREQNINYFQSSGYPGIVYIQTRYESVFAECIAYVDRTLHSRYLKQSWFGRMFGGGPDWNSAEANNIRKEVGRILMNSYRG